MNKKVKKGPNKRQKKLARMQVRVALEPGQDPRPVSALEALAKAEFYLEQREFGSCGQICAQLINGSKLFVEPYILMLRVALQMGRVREALDIATKLLAHGVNTPYEALVLSHALTQCNRHHEALELLSEFIKKFPADYRLREKRADIFADLGRHDTAVDELRVVTKMSPRRFGAYRTLSSLSALTDSEIAFLRSAKPKGEDLEFVNFALALEHARRGEKAGELECLRVANEAMGDRLQYDHATEMNRSDKLIAWSTEEFVNSFNLRDKETDARPVFVVGMPRSGATLIEQILSSHPQIGTAGETPIFENILVDIVRTRHPGTDWPDILLKLTAGDLGYLADEYRSAIADVFTDAGIFIDKTLGHCRYVGLLAAALPNAKFIHSLRHPLDNCLSCYQQASEEMDFGTNLVDAANRYLDHLRIMDHWKSILGDRIMTVNYENLVANHEDQTRSMLEFCEVPWSDDVLDFYNRERAVRAASWTQVRKPIYDSSENKWQGYSELVEPAKQILEPVLGPL